MLGSLEPVELVVNVDGGNPAVRTYPSLIEDIQSGVVGGFVYYGPNVGTDTARLSGIAYPRNADVTQRPAASSPYMYWA